MSERARNQARSGCAAASPRAQRRSAPSAPAATTCATAATTSRTSPTHASFEEVAYLLLYGKLPTAPQLDAISRLLAACRDLPPALKDVLERIPATPHPMDVLRTGCLDARHARTRSAHTDGAAPPGSPARRAAVDARLLASLRDHAASASRPRRTSDSRRACAASACTAQADATSTKRSWTRRSSFTPSTSSTPRPSPPASSRRRCRTSTPP